MLTNKFIVTAGNKPFPPVQGQSGQSIQTSIPMPICASHHMPPEILAQIFQCTQTTPDSPHLGLGWVEECLADMNDTISLSHTCRYWRNVALSHSSLWANINILHPASKVFASRSSTSSLRLLAWRIGMDADDGMACNLAWLPNHVNHIGVLLIRLDLWMMARILSVLGDNFPRLSQVQLEIDSESAFMVEGPGVHPAFKACPPNLASLRLSYVSANVDFFSNLRSLSLENIFFSFDHFSCSAVQLLELLRRSPRLEQLNLSALGIDNPAAGERDPPIVELPHLQYCFLRQLDITMWLLDHLYIPASAPIIRDIGDEDEDLDYDPDLDPERWEHSQLNISPENWEIKFGRKGVELPISIRPLINRNLVSFIPRLVTTFDFALMPQLTISLRRDKWLYHPPPGVVIWTEFLSRLPSLTVLNIVVEREWLTNILMALFTEVPSHAQLTGSSYLCPGLEVLCIEAITSSAQIQDGPFPLTEVDIARLEVRQQRLDGTLKYLGLSFRDEVLFRRLGRFVKEVEFAKDLVSDQSDSEIYDDDESEYLMNFL